MVEDYIFDALITKYFYSMLNMFLVLFQPQGSDVDHLRPFKGEECIGQRCV